MKKYFIALLFGVVVSFAFPQSSHHPPRAVSESFQKEYPHSTPSHWSHSATGWSVDFDDKDFDNGEVTAHFDSRGKHLETQIPYDDGDVPAPVKDNLRKQYPGSDHYEYTRIDRPGNKPVYKARFMHENKYKSTYVDQNGERQNYH